MEKTLAIAILGERAPEAFRFWRSAKRAFRTLPVRIRRGTLRMLFPIDSFARNINIGGGRWWFRRWENVDCFVEDVYIDHKLDFRDKRPLALPDACASRVFCSHTLEHVSDDVCLFLLGEAHRLLKSGGVLRISVPDLDKAVDAYEAGDESFFDEGGVVCGGGTIENKLVGFLASYWAIPPSWQTSPPVSPEDVRDNLRSLSRVGFARWCVSLLDPDAPNLSHVNAYSFDKMREFLRTAGFQQIERSEFRCSSSAVMREKAFDNRPRVSLFVEAFKN